MGAWTCRSKTKPGLYLPVKPSLQPGSCGQGDVDSRAIGSRRGSFGQTLGRAGILELVHHCPTWQGSVGCSPDPVNARWRFLPTQQDGVIWACVSDTPWLLAGLYYLPVRCVQPTEKSQVILWQSDARNQNTECQLRARSSTARIPAFEENSRPGRASDVRHRKHSGPAWCPELVESATPSSEALCLHEPTNFIKTCA